MRIEIFVVRSPKEDKVKLAFAKRHLIELFGGLTIIPNCLGAWIDKKGVEITDNVEIWLIYTRSYEPSESKGLKWYMYYIKDATNQRSQLYALNGHHYFI